MVALIWMSIRLLIDEFLRIHGSGSEIFDYLLLVDGLSMDMIVWSEKCGVEYSVFLMIN